LHIYGNKLPAINKSGWQSILRKGGTGAVLWVCEAAGHLHQREVGLAVGKHSKACDDGSESSMNGRVFAVRSDSRTITAFQLTELGRRLAIKYSSVLKSLCICSARIRICVIDLSKPHLIPGCILHIIAYFVLLSLVLLVLPHKLMRRIIRPPSACETSQGSTGKYDSHYPLLCGESVLHLRYLLCPRLLHIACAGRRRWPRLRVDRRG